MEHNVGVGQVLRGVSGIMGLIKLRNSVKNRLNGQIQAL